MFSPDHQYAVVLAISKAHDRGDTSCVFCLKLVNNERTIHASGNPFKLLNERWSPIWRNDNLRELRINFGSIIVADELTKFEAVTERKMDVHEVFEVLVLVIKFVLQGYILQKSMKTLLSLVQFGDGQNGRAYQGIEEAFPEAEIPPSGCKGIWQRTGKQPHPPYALISIVKASTVDDRIVLETRLGEIVNLNNRSRVCQHSSIGEDHLPLRKPNSGDDVGDLILVGFGSPTAEGNYLAVCEGLLLRLASEHWPQQDGKMTQAGGENLSKHHLCQKAENVSPAGEPRTFYIKPTDLSKLPAHTHPFSEDVYRMTSNPRGIALIINNEVFSPSTEADKENLEDRQGSEKDVSALQMLFKALNFKVITVRNKGGHEILQILDRAANYDHSAYDCFVLCLMSHGQEGLFYGSDGDAVSLETVCDLFSHPKCTTLRGKPKLMFIQACRGRDSQDGVVHDAPFCQGPNQAAATAPDDSFREWNFAFKGTIPDHSDILKAYATVNHYVSFRDECYGSRFVRCLVEVFQEKAGHEDVLSMLTMVNDRLSKMGDIGSKQVGQPTSTLTKKLFFWPGMFMQAQS